MGSQRLSTIGENFQRVETIVYDYTRSYVPTIVAGSSTEFLSSTKRRRFVYGSDMQIVKIKIVLVIAPIGYGILQYNKPQIFNKMINRIHD